MNIPPPILEKVYKQGGDDDGDDHEHEEEQNLYTQWRLATNSDGSPLLVCIQCTQTVTTEEAGVVSHGRPLLTYSNTRCMVLGMDTSVLAPTPSPWYRIDSLGENSLHHWIVWSKEERVFSKTINTEPGRRCWS